MIAELQIGKLNGDSVRSLPIKALSTSENGWSPHPFQIVSLFEMLFGPVIHHFLGYMRDLEGYIFEITWDASQCAPKGYFEPPKIDYYRQTVNLFVQPCGMIGIDISDQVARVHEVLDQKSSDQVKKFESRFEEVKFKIEDELKRRSFLYVSPEFVKYFDQDELFGSHVKTRFPEASTEIKLAGNCYATEAYTACVFHLMRAVEIGARVLVKNLRVTKKLPRKVELCDWGELTNTLEGGLKVVAVGRRKSLKGTERSEFYNHAVSQFRNFKDAWRNNVSHTRKTYEPGQTKDIMENTRQFMQHLATRLKE